ncbi:MAG: hypothetical protein LBD85_04255 [Oscillospiraceae bacterium]|jgi:hypothetical protein|nr:hypothetical protein [Oscillospiraceae bacterium]
MNKFTIRKLLAIVFAVVLVLALALTALAAWPSFQNDNSNNGVITNGTPPTATPTTVISNGLTTNNPGGAVYTGIDAASVINGGTVYTVYNGGVAGSNAIGGARLAITDLATGASRNIQLDAQADNVSQLSTPYLDTGTGTLYALTTRGGGVSSVWALWAVTNLSGATPNVRQIANGQWQANTPITPNTNVNAAYIYFGTWSTDANYTGVGDGAYYQFDTSTGTLTQFKPVEGDDFYGAGAAIVPVNNANYVVFGSDGYRANLASIYVQPVGANFATSANVIPMSSRYSTDKIRSSVAHDANSRALYFTSRTAASGTYTGEVWQLPINSLLTAGNLGTLATAASLGNYASTSTPVISENGYVYIGYYYYNASFVGNGGVAGILAANFQTGSLFDVYGNGISGTGTAGDPVQSSAIVSSGVDPDTELPIDYIYFTTNSASGKGYAYSYTENSKIPRVGVVASLWSAGGTSGNPYAVQGFASDSGYLVYGDDGNNLYIMK